MIEGRLDGIREGISVGWHDRDDVKLKLVCASVGRPLGIIVTPASTPGATVGKKKFGDILGSEEGGKLDEQGSETVGV